MIPIAVMRPGIIFFPVTHHEGAAIYSVLPDAVSISGVSLLGQISTWG